MLCIKDIGQVRFDTSCGRCYDVQFCNCQWWASDALLYLICDQDAEKVQLDECCQGLSKLIQDQLFLTSMVHALEEQKSFTIEDKSVFHYLPLKPVYVTVFYIQHDANDVCVGIRAAVVQIYSIFCLVLLTPLSYSSYSASPLYF